jgi:hypothetical protein
MMGFPPVKIVQFVVMFKPILFPNEHVPRCAANFSFWLT